MLKKLTLLAMAVGALIAFAAPSMASAAEWKTNGVAVGGTTATGDAVHFTGTLSSTKGPVKISCNATANTILWNEGGNGVGEATLTLSADPVETGFCTVAVFNGTVYQPIPCHVNPSATGANWPISTEGTEVFIEEANFTNEFVGEPCLTILGIPSGTKISDKGTAEGVVEGECIVFNNTGGFEGGSKIDGSLCPTTTGLSL